MLRRIRGETAKPKPEQEIPARHKKLIRSIQGALSLDLRHPDYPVSEEEYESATYGHCYVATEAVYHLFAREEGYVPHVYRHEDGTHWWLVHEETGQILDPTEPQLRGKRFPYHKGHRQNFLTKKPSKRQRNLLGVSRQHKNVVVDCTLSGSS